MIGPFKVDSLLSPGDLILAVRSAPTERGQYAGIMAHQGFVLSTVAKALIERDPGLLDGLATAPGIAHLLAEVRHILSSFVEDTAGAVERVELQHRRIALAALASRAAAASTKAWQVLASDPGSPAMSTKRRPALARTNGATKPLALAH